MKAVWVAPIVAAAAIVAASAYASYEYLEAPGNQLFGSTVVRGPASARVVALTYDDGPNPPYTTAILRVLREENVHVTFFVVGRAAAAYPAVVREEYADGNAIGNHTWEHEHLIVRTPEQIDDSLARTDAAVYAATGSHTTLLRPPFGARDWLVLHEARRLGYTPVMWSVPLADDWEYPPAAAIAQRILRHVSDGAIMVLHDGNRGEICTAKDAHDCDRSADVVATRTIVETLKREGYRFVTIPQLLALPAVTRTSDRGRG
jgi:peptidoglycan/xylan/chitin deacetylase (PgdA/CDA1 family)